MANQRLAAAFVRAVSKPGRYGDGGRGSFGLSLLVRPSGKHWQQRYRKNGKYSSRGLGVYPAVTLEQARELAFFYAHEGKPSIVRAILGATEEQLAERLTPKRIELKTDKTFAAMTAEVAVDRELRLPTFRQTFIETVEVRARGYAEGSKTEKQWKNLFDAYIPALPSRSRDGRGNVKGLARLRGSRLARKASDGKKAESGTQGDI